MMFGKCTNSFGMRVRNKVSKIQKDSNQLEHPGFQMLPLTGTQSCEMVHQTIVKLLRALKRIFAALLLLIKQ